jgi:uncharacterized protein (TIGR04255 family)
MTFSNPPIVEAIFHLVVERDGEFDHETLKDYVNSISEDFPKRRENRLLGGDIQYDPQKTDSITSSLSNVLQGYTVSSDNESSVIQVNSSSFSFSLLNYYEGWDVFYERANKYWQKYIEITSAKRISRLSLRYLNRIKIPFTGGSFDLEDYVEVSPMLSSQSDDWSMAGYFMQIALVSKKYSPSRAILNQALGSPEKNTDQSSMHVPLIFDTEVFQDINVDSHDNIIEYIFTDNLRCFKNDVFFENITEKTKELFQ